MKIIHRYLAIISLLIKAYKALNYAKARGIPGLDFAYFGRRIALKLLSNISIYGLRYYLVPVNILRYFEFEFTFSQLSEKMIKCLDVGSPRLFSFFVASNYPLTSIHMINPDSYDIQQTSYILSKINLINIKYSCLDINSLINFEDSFDCIWSISVLEHITGLYDDRFALIKLFSYLKKGGKLIITIPVDRNLWNEFRELNYYGTQNKDNSGQYFFQRYYDKKAIWERLVAAVGIEPKVVRWFGETTPGRFAAYERRWMMDGYKCTVEDPREIADHYQEFSSWEDMPGKGICGLVFEK